MNPTRALLALGALAVVLLGAVAVDLARGVHPDRAAPRWPVPAGDPDRGRLAVERHGCGACHVIPGVPGAEGRVGPPLDGLRERAFVGGVLANTPENLAAWIRDPPRYSPETAMPALGLTEREADDIAAWLLSR